MTGCTEAVERLWTYLQGELPASAAQGVEAHLARCRRCCGELEFARRLQGLLSSAATTTDLPPAVAERLDGVLDALEEEPWTT